MNPSTHSDPASKSGLSADTLRRVRERDAEAMNEFFDAYYDRVFAYVSHNIGGGEIAEDLTQEVFLRLHRSLERLDPKRDPSAWVFTLAINLVRDYWRSREHRHRHSRMDLDALGAHPEGRVEGDAHDKLEKQEREALLRRAMMELNEQDRQLIVMRSFEEFSTEELAKLFKTKTGAIRQRFSRALKRLGTHYEKLAGKEGR
jgi:RNA polymerase sigma-70 factor (ECF subfamily)